MGAEKIDSKVINTHFMLLPFNILISGRPSHTIGDATGLIMRVTFDETVTSLIVTNIAVHDKAYKDVNSILHIRAVSNNIYKVICEEKSKKHWNVNKVWW